MPEQVQPEDIDTTILACIYGASGTGKTALGTHLPWGTKQIGERAIYIAGDNASERMESVSLKDREHLIPWKLTTKKVKQPDGSIKETFDPHSEAMELAQMDWKAKYPDCNTVIWDGFTETAEQILRAYANTGAFSSASSGDKHVMVGVKGTPTYMAQPMEGDYGMAGNGIGQILTYLFRKGMTIILICQEDIAQPRGNANASAGVGGPATVGAKTINRVASKFNTVVRLTATSVTVPDAKGKLSTSIKYTLYSEPRGVWLAKLRKDPNIPNPIPELDITGEGRAKFWETLIGFTKESA